MWPDSYLSRGQNQDHPAAGAGEMVPAAINQQYGTAHDPMMQTIESRSVLTTIIQTKNLYPKDRGSACRSKTWSRK